MLRSITNPKYRDIYILWGLHFVSIIRPAEKSDANIIGGLMINYQLWVNKLRTTKDEEVKKNALPIVRFLMSEITRRMPPERLRQIIAELPDEEEMERSSTFEGPEIDELIITKETPRSSADRDRIMASIRDQVNSEMASFGVFVDDVRIRRADLPRENTEAILSRMQSERHRVAAQARAEGAEAAQKIRADADRDRTVILADASAQAEELRGEGQAAASRLYASAFGQDPTFFGIWRRLEAYRAAFDDGRTRLVLTPDNDFLRYLLNPPSSP